MTLVLEPGTNIALGEFEQAWKKLVERVRLAHMATVSESGEPHINACYYSFTSPEALVVLTPPSTKHSRNLKSHPFCSVALSLMPPRVGDSICGAQIECHAKEMHHTESPFAYECYVNKFPEFAMLAPSAQFILDNFQSRFYLLSIKSGKLIDEDTFGREIYVSFLNSEYADRE